MTELDRWQFRQRLQAVMPLLRGVDLAAARITLDALNSGAGDMLYFRRRVAGHEREAVKTTN
jgi:hypothetical protein